MVHALLYERATNSQVASNVAVGNNHVPALRFNVLEGEAMIARITTPGPQETWHSDVVAAWSERGYLKLRLERHPHLVFYWLDNRYTRTEALREERRPEYHEEDEVKRI